MTHSVKIRRQDAINYHEQDPAGKIEVIPTKDMRTQRDLALAYTPGVAEPCKDIADNALDVYKYTAKGNLVAVITNGTAVLGLGNIGPAASKPVMEGKGVLFKKFSGIDVFDIEVDAEDPEEFIRIVKALEPTFGGINLEDIKAPESFLIEDRLKAEMDIPVMHDDQHGTAIISAAAMINALDIVNKKIGDINMVINGAGAAAISCGRLYITLGVKRENIIMLDSKGVIRKDRGDLAKTKAEFATTIDVNTLEEAIKGADMFVGLSVADVLTPKMVLTMAKNPIVFAMANPNPEIAYDKAMDTRDDLIMATGRSDHPNQVNNVLGFPYLFRGALDVKATSINEEMKLAAVKALYELARQPVPELVARAYSDRRLTYGPFYLIPKPLDPRLITAVSTEVAKAAIKSGVARHEITDWDLYKQELRRKIGIDDKLVNSIINRAKKYKKRIVFAEADNYKVLKAAQLVNDEHIGIPILLGDPKLISKVCEEFKIELFDCKIIDIDEETTLAEKFEGILYEKRKRKGFTKNKCRKLIRDRNYFAAMMVETGEADAVITGLTKEYSASLRPALHVIGVDPAYKKVAGMYFIMNKKGVFFFADTTVQVDPTAEELVDIIGMAADTVRFFSHEPRIAVLSYSNFGSVKGEIPDKVMKAVKLAKEKYPDLIIDGDLQANVAINAELQNEIYPFSELSEIGANTLIFPNLVAGNIAYKLLMELEGTHAIGPVLLGLNKSFHILQLGTSVREIVRMAAIAAIQARIVEKRDELKAESE